MLKFKKLLLNFALKLNIKKDMMLVCFNNELKRWKSEIDVGLIKISHLSFFNFFLQLFSKTNKRILSVLSMYAQYSKNELT